MSLREMVSREIVELPDGEEKLLVFYAVEANDLALGQLVRLTGPVDLDRYGAFPMELTNPRTGLKARVDGVRFWVSEENGLKVDKPLNVVSKRLIGQLHGDLASGEIFRTRYAITSVGAPPRTDYQVRRIPMSPPS